MLMLEGRHAVITGGSSGIGRAIFHALADAGARTTILARDHERAQQVAAERKDAQALALDVSDEPAVARVFDEAAAAAGPIDVLVNNAGAAESAPFAKLDSAHWRRMLDVNLTGVFLCTRAVYAGMLERGRGRIINIASTSGLKGYAYSSAYSAAKHGVIGLTRSLALEAARSEVTVNAICPGFSNTPLLREAVERIVAKTGRSEEQALAELLRHNPQGRLVEPEEIAQTVLWLCSAAARSVNGQAIALAGGEWA